MDDELERLLQTELLAVPDDFTERVMRSVHAAPAMPRRETRQWLQWLALIAGAALGAMELATFIFGIWAATTAS